MFLLYVGFTALQFWPQETDAILVAPSLHKARLDDFGVPTTQRDIKHVIVESDNGTSSNTASSPTAAHEDLLNGSTTLAIKLLVPRCWTLVPCPPLE